MAGLLFPFHSKSIKLLYNWIFLHLYVNLFKASPIPNTQTVFLAFKVVIQKLVKMELEGMLYLLVNPQIIWDWDWCSPSWD